MLRQKLLDMIKRRDALGSTGSPDHWICPACGKLVENRDDITVLELAPMPLPRLMLSACVCRSCYEEHRDIANAAVLLLCATNYGPTVVAALAAYAVGLYRPDNEEAQYVKIVEAAEQTPDNVFLPSLLKFVTEGAYTSYASDAHAMSKDNFAGAADVLFFRSLASWPVGLVPDNPETQACIVSLAAIDGPCYMVKLNPNGSWQLVRVIQDDSDTPFNWHKMPWCLMNGFAEQSLSGIAARS